MKSSESVDGRHQGEAVAVVIAAGAYKAPAVQAVLPRTTHLDHKTKLLVYSSIITSNITKTSPKPKENRQCTDLRPINPGVKWGR